MNKITQKEAENFLEMIKYTLTDKVNLPESGATKEFTVVGNNKKDVFVINIFKGKIKRTKFNLGARVSKNNILLLELHINPSNIHVNPNGEKIKGSHWHVYTEEHDRRLAIPAEDINCEDFVKNTITFLKKFNVVTIPTISCQQEMLY